MVREMKLLTDSKGKKVLVNLLSITYCKPEYFRSYDAYTNTKITFEKGHSLGVQETIEELNEMMG